MTTTVKIIEDSIYKGVRITTMQLRYPRFILAELNTHGRLAKSTRSTRAVPTKKLIKEVRENPFVPEKWPSMQSGMQGGPALRGWRRLAAVGVWLVASRVACLLASAMVSIGVHKQHAGRLLEPFMWVDTVVTATEWENFFNLRISPLAQPEFDKLARVMRFEMDVSTPAETRFHLPYLSDVEKASDASLSDKFEVSARRCSQVSYAPHDGSKADFYKDRAKAHELLAAGHMSPFEHPALTLGEYRPNKFRPPWVQHRKHILHEENPLGGQAVKDHA